MGGARIMRWTDYLQLEVEAGTCRVGVYGMDDLDLLPEPCMAVVAATDDAGVEADLDRLLGLCRWVGDGDYGGSVFDLRVAPARDYSGAEDELRRAERLFREFERPFDAHAFMLAQVKSGEDVPPEWDDELFRMETVGAMAECLASMLGGGEAGAERGGGR